MKVFLVLFHRAKSIMFEKIMPGKKYPSIISNTDRSHQDGKQWWSILNILSKSELLFLNFFVINGMKIFIVSNDKKIIGKVLKGPELAGGKDNKSALIKLKFLMKRYKNLSTKEIFNLYSIA